MIQLLEEGYTGKLRLTNKRDVNFSLSNNFDNTWDLQDAIEDSQSVDDALKAVNTYALYRQKWSLKSDDNAKTVFTSTDALGNVHYLYCYKDGEIDDAVYSGKLSLTNSRRTPYSLSNAFDDVRGLKAEVEECTSADDLVSVVNSFSDYKWSIAKDKSDVTRLTSNSEYILLVFKA